MQAPKPTTHSQSKRNYQVPTKFNDCKSESKHLEQIIYELYEVFIAKEYAFQQAKTQNFGKNPSSSWDG